MSTNGVHFQGATYNHTTINEFGLSKTRCRSGNCALTASATVNRASVESGRATNFNRLFNQTNGGSFSDCKAQNLSAPNVIIMQDDIRDWQLRGKMLLLVFSGHNETATTDRQSRRNRPFRRRTRCRIPAEKTNDNGVYYNGNTPSRGGGPRHAIN